jgi:drug/metabolite transporter (DMT)-like permease
VPPVSHGKHPNSGFLSLGSACANGTPVNQRLRADLALVLCSFLWGTTFVIVQQALADSSVFAFLAVRFTIASVLLGVLYRADLRRMSRAEFVAGLQIGAAMFLGYAFQTAGLQRTTPSKAAFITGVSVVLVPVFMAMFFRRPANSWIWVGALASLSGLYYVTVPSAESAAAKVGPPIAGVLNIGGLNLGDALVLICAVAFAFQIILIGQYSPRYSVGVLTFLQIAVTAICSTLAIPFASVTRIEQPRLIPTGTVIFAILATAIFTTAFAFTMLVWAQRHTPPAHAALILATEPVFAALTSYLTIHERFGARALLGAALIFAGILLVELKGQHPIPVES